MPKQIDGLAALVTREALGVVHANVDHRNIASRGLPTQPKARSPRLNYLAGKLHSLGPYPLAQFLKDIDRVAGVRETLEIYASLPADFIRDLGGDQFAPALFTVSNNSDRDDEREGGSL
ncbi:hypothetical protein [Methylocella sp.]|jgi:hypothetical protein|uniref:hypothetical protein n=1 Tax=Methylocella sp. TaxID=1978226 RepID=UPI003C160B06